MPKIKYSIRYKKNEGLIISVQELINLYFYGVEIRSKDGTLISDEVIKTYIKAATEEVEKYLDLKIVKTFVEETNDFHRDSYNQIAPIITLSYFINEPLSLIGRFGTAEQLKFPKSWLTYKRSNQDRYRKYLSLIPTGSGTTSDSGDVLLTGIIANRGIMGLREVPAFYTTKYITGFNKVPYDLLNVIGRVAAIELFNIAGDLILGAGIANMSLGIDGLNQSVGSTSSATSAGYGARVIQYQKENKEILTKLKLRYKTINLTIL